MNKKLFIYKITTNRDWYLLCWSVEFHEFMINCYDAIKNEIIENLDEFPSEDDFEVYKSSISVKEKFIHYIITWYCKYGNGLFLMNDKDEVYFIIDEKLDEEELQLLNEIETDNFLNEIIEDFGLETTFNKVQKYYLEHCDEINQAFKEVEEHFSKHGLKDILEKDGRYGSVFQSLKTEEFNDLLK